MTNLLTIPKYGDNSHDTTLLQIALNNRKCPCPIDGVFLGQTLAAVKQAQKANGTVGTGVIGPKTLQYLGLSHTVIAPTTGQKTITQDLPGKGGRHIHPAIRVMLEAKLFPAGLVPPMWHKSPGDDVSDVAIAIAKALATLGIHEVGGNNRGQQVGEIQYTVDANSLTGHLGSGDAWCEDTAEIIPAFIEDFYKVLSPMISSQSTQAVWQAALKVPGLTTETPTAGAQALGQHQSAKSTGHAMFCVGLNLAAGTMDTVEGNTSIKNMSDGDALGAKVRKIWNNGDIKTLGFIYVYPHNLLPAPKAA